MKRSETLDPRIRPLTEAERERLRGHAPELVAYRQTVRRGTWIALSVVLPMPSSRRRRTRAPAGRSTSGTSSPVRSTTARTLERKIA